MTDLRTPFSQAYLDQCLAPMRAAPVQPDDFDHAHQCRRYHERATDETRSASDREFLAGQHDYHLACHLVQQERLDPGFVPPAGGGVRPDHMAFVPRFPVLPVKAPALDA